MFRLPRAEYSQYLLLEYCYAVFLLFQEETLNWLWSGNLRQKCVLMTEASLLIKNLGICFLHSPKATQETFGSRSKIIVFFKSDLWPAFRFSKYLNIWIIHPNQSL